VPPRKQGLGRGDELGGFLLGKVGEGALSDLAVRVLADEVAEIRSRIRVRQHLGLDRVRVVTRSGLRMPSTIAKERPASTAPKRSSCWSAPRTIS
jgi:hypothetical protein